MRVIITFLFIVLYLNGHSQFNNDFENDTSLLITIDTSIVNNIWQIGKPNKSLFNSAFSLPNAIVTDTINNYGINEYSVFEFSISDSNFWVFPYFAIEFRQKFDTDFRKDGGWIEASYDSGSTWINIFEDSVYFVNIYVQIGGALPDTLENGQIGFTGTNNIFYRYSLCWANGVGNPPLPEIGLVMIRFVFYSDSIDNNQEGWILDDFRVYPTIIENVREYQNYDGIKILPNPVSKSLRYKIEDYQHERFIINIYDIQGRKVKSLTQNEVKAIDISDLEDGIYILNIKSENLNSLGKFIKK